MTQVFVGGHRIVVQLDRGGMAEVFLTMTEGPQGTGFVKLAVVKKLRAGLIDDREFLDMMVDEARIAARLNHPNVVQTFDAGMAGESYYIAMEYLDGQPLHRIQKRAKRMGAPFSLDLQILTLVDALNGLHHAHELTDFDGTPLQVVHRDVSPANVFVTYAGVGKIVDFGVAKAMGRISATQPGILKGKVRYMSPEHAMALPVDRRADIFSVGVMLWEAATGQRFWGSMEELEIFRALTDGAYPRSPKKACPTVDDEVDRICRRALARNPDERYGTAAEMKCELEHHLGSRIVAARADLGPMIAALFAKEREQLRGIIEQALQEGSRRSSATPSPVRSAPPTGTLKSPGLESVSPMTTAAPPAPKSERSSRRSAEPHAPPRRPRLLVVAAVGVAAAAAIVSFGTSPVLAQRSARVATDERRTLVQKHRGLAARPSSPPPAPVPAPRWSPPHRATAPPPSPPAVVTTTPPPPPEPTSSPSDKMRRKPRAIDTVDPFEGRD